MNEASAGAPQSQPLPDVNVEELSRGYGAALTRYFLRRGFDVADAQDLAQEVFTRLARPGALSNVDRPDAYLFTMAANLVVEHHRRQTVRRVHMPENFVDSIQLTGDFSPERVVSGRQELELIVTTLNEMPERMRNIFILARLENMPRAEIAVRIGVSKRTVEAQLSLATAILAGRRSRLA